MVVLFESFNLLLIVVGGWWNLFLLFAVELVVIHFIVLPWYRVETEKERWRK